MTNNENKKSSFEIREQELSIDIVQLLNKCLRRWPWFLVSIFCCLLVAVVYLKYSNKIYITEAKVKCIDDRKNSNFSMDISKAFSKSVINLESEKAVLKSHRLNKKVVENLKLNISYFSKDGMKRKQQFNPPFWVTYILPESSLSTVAKFDVSLTPTGYKVINKESGKAINTEGYWFKGRLPDFPINIQLSPEENIDKYNDYEVILKPLNLAAFELSNEINLASIGKNSDIISLTLKSSNGKHAQKILNNLIKVFEEDGVGDNQEISRRTIDFVNDRLVFLKQELDRIETSKKEFKKNNNLSFIQGDIEESIRKKSFKEQSLFEMDSQLLLVELLQNSLSGQSGIELLPADIGVSNKSINQLVEGYNSSVLEYQKLKTSAGMNNPSLTVLVNSINNQKRNLLNSVKGYQQQLLVTHSQDKIAHKKAEGSFAALPEKETILRSIERQQNLKESLYLLLLKKREEASINLAVVVPNTKIIDYAITQDTPIAPKTNVILMIALVAGLFIPFGILFLLVIFDLKVYTGTDVEKINNEIAVLGEIPSAKEHTIQEEKDVEASEAFRTLVQNTEFITPETDNKLGKVYFVTSSIKGEGKTFVSYHLANAYAQLGKKVLLVGADLRNPQLHKHIDQTKGNRGLSNYLYNSALQWKDMILRNKDDDFSIDILLAGDIPPKPMLLLSNQKFGTLVEEARKEYDAIVFDTSPTLLVSDTLIISKFADVTLFVIRSGVTEKKLVSYSARLHEEHKLKNMGYVINDIDIRSDYNYGYGYSYGRYEEKKSWLNHLIKFGFKPN
ncbi:tyrosine-protein kinase family protein [Flavobacterium sp. DG2-3]|uniref:GumC family protein n=1 Tax=Flavobacterium sp. DG2-3 TaxID=3068317 RepID=UPI00273E3079|nr:tyrosine-protein kinase family protein [Flavobacterium sp. DG2-3]MDP5199127.1 polysaccharide biosynthesis tyrosine autokinase [Flavobacterium sp. DG2-3]